MSKELYNNGLVEVDWEKKQVSLLRPGSPKAIKKGCTCVGVTNHSSLIRMPFWLSADCKLHTNPAEVDK